MNVQMVAQEFTLTPSLREHLEHCLRCAFARTRSKIARIIVQLRDLNGSDGSRDKLCQVNVTIPGQPEVVIREVQENMYNAIDFAMKRAAYRAMRLIMKKRKAPQEADDHG